MVEMELIRALREQTGAGVMHCKSALAESSNDLGKAIDYLRKKGLATALKKGGRVTGEGLITSYIHAGGKIGVLLEVCCETDFVARTPDFQALAKDLAMQIAGATPPPLYIQREDVPADAIEKERAICVAQAQTTGKPEAVVTRIAEGRLEKFFQEVCLLEQAFIKNPEITIKALVAERVAKLGENIQVKRFTRYRLGSE